MRECKIGAINLSPLSHYEFGDMIKTSTEGIHQMKPFRLLLLLSTIILLAAGTTQSQWENTGLSQLEWVHALAVDNGMLFAGTWGHGIFRSIDGGVTWDSANYGLPEFYARWVEALTVAQSTGGGTIIFAGFEYGGVFRSTDDGNSWAEANTGMIPQTNLAALGSAGSTVLVGLRQNGGDNGVYRTVNDGGNWAPADGGFATQADSSIWGFAVSPPGGAAGAKFFVATDGGVFMSSSDGIGWTPVNNGLPSGVARAVGVTSGFGHNNLFACISDKGVYRSTDDGTSWVEADDGLPTLSSVYVTDFISGPSTGLAGTPSIFAATSIGVYVSTNNGVKWWDTGTELFRKEGWPSCLTILGDYLYAGGYQGGGVWKYSTRIDTGWAVQPSGTGDMLYTVKAVDNNVVWAGGTNGCVLRTTNGGVTWDSVGAGVIGTATVFSVDALDASNALVSTYTGDAAIYKTTNGGSIWQNVFAQTGGAIAGIRMKSTLEGYAVGIPVDGKWTVLKTTDGGNTWTHIPNEPTQIGDESVTFGVDLTGNTLSFGTTSGKIYRSTDLGTTWSSDSISEEMVYAIHSNSPTIGLAGFYNGAIDRTTNGGVSWDTAHSAGGNSVNCISGLENEYWATVGSGIAYTNDTGKSWKYSSPGYHGFIQLQALSFSSAGSAINGWAVGEDGIILHYRRGLTGVKPDLRTIPAAFVLEQNYPNPFNPATFINYQLPNASHVRLSVYNMLGQEVTTLVNEIEQAGAQSVRFDASNLPSGVYLYRLQAGTYTSVKKLVLIR
jgi:photosystem II stability/assembly factor-like uncharacterized protein